MKLHVSHGGLSAAGEEDWFVVHPLPGKTKTSVAGTPMTHEMAVESLLNAGRAVYEIDTDRMTIVRMEFVPRSKW